MNAEFESFVIFAEMRTGSNFLETNLNAIDGVHCFGEAFNPYFIGYPNKQTLLDTTLAQRESDPASLLGKIRRHEGKTGFRFFHDHDPRVLQQVIDDRRCAKVILTRNPLESFVSWKIAQSTGQWKLTDVSRRRGARMHFDLEEFADYLNAQSTFHSNLREQLQRTGQAAFELRYEDLQSLDVINGLAAYLGAEGRLEKLDQSLKVQNPSPIAEKVENADELQRALAAVSTVDTQLPPTREPARSAAVTTYFTSRQVPLVFLPVQAGPSDVVLPWLAALEDGSVENLQTGMSQKDLRQWKRSHVGHRSFSVVRHPVARAHYCYCNYILGQGSRVYTAIRQKLSHQTDGAIPHEEPGADYDLPAHRSGFMAFLEFLAANLSGQTSIRVDAAWAHQAQIVSGFARFALPDIIFREQELLTELPSLARHFGHESPEPENASADKPFALAEIYCEDVESAVRKVYQRDYMMFGFGNWA